MSGSGFLDRAGSDAETRARSRNFGQALFRWRSGVGLANVRQAAAQLGVGPQFLADAEAGRTDPLGLAPSTAVRLILRTGLSATHLGFEDPDGEGSKPPLESGGAPAGAAVPSGGAAGSTPKGPAAPVTYARHGSPIGAWYEAPGTIRLRIGGDERRLGELLTALTIDEAEQVSAALAQAASAGRRVHANANQVEGR